MNSNYSIASESDSHEAIQLLEDKIYIHNSSKLNKHDGRLFSRIVRDERNGILAGIGGWTWAGICEITQLWVDEKVRKNGLGKMLLEEAEAEAKGQGCHTILVRSFSFQAPDFYKKFGFKTEHVMDGFPESHTYHFLSKKIQPPVTIQ